MPARGGALLDLNQPGRIPRPAAAQQERAAESLMWIKYVSPALRYGHPDYGNLGGSAAATCKGDLYGRRHP